MSTEKKIMVGGQAVMEGVLMRSPDSYAVAVRRPNGDIVVKKDGTDIQLDRQLFLMMLKRMSILSSEEYKGVIFHFSKDKLLINSTNPEIGESKEDMNITYEGDDIEVMYNPKFFIDTLSVINEDNVVLNILDEEKPCKIEGENDKSYLSVIMPMRI